jgi:phosphatidylglycerophosphate synthase
VTSLTRPTPAPDRVRPSRGPWGMARGAGAATGGVLGLVALPALLAATVGPHGVGPAFTAWVVGLGCGLLLTVLVRRGLSASGLEALGPADRVTFGRGLLACAVAALTTQALLGRPSPAALLAITVPALALDAVDGRVARRTGTVSAFGARFDGEVDAFLILVLSVASVPSLGWWVLGGGLARYVFGAAGWVLPWMRAPLPFRYWRKVATAVVGIALTVSASGVLGHPAGVVAGLLAVAVLGESFGRDVLWLRARRPRSVGPPRPRSRRRVVLGRWGTGAGLALAWCALLAPDRPAALAPPAFVRVPVEGLVMAAFVLLLPARARRPVGAALGVAVGLVGLAKVLDLGAVAVLDRPFDAATDLGQLSSGLSFVDDALGGWAATGSVVAGVLLVLVLLVGLPVATRQAAVAVDRHRGPAALAVTVLSLGWMGCSAAGVALVPGQPVAAADAVPWTAHKVGTTVAAVRDAARFDAAVAHDTLAGGAPVDLSALRGKDVLVVFVESYGRVALEGPSSAPIRDLLDDATGRLAAAGFGARSGYLTSPTFGGGSWLAHSTLQSGLWVSDQARYDRLLASRRATVTSAFAGAGWRTVAVLPSTHGDWPEGRSFYDFDAVHGRSGLGYAGPSFGFSAMPDQFTLAALDRLELGRAGRPPVMAEVELTSSHGPWAPQPTTVDWSALGLPPDPGAGRDGHRAVERPVLGARRLPDLHRVLPHHPPGLGRAPRRGGPGRRGPR